LFVITPPPAPASTQNSALDFRPPRRHLHPAMNTPTTTTTPQITTPPSSQANPPTGPDSPPAPPPPAEDDSAPGSIPSDATLAAALTLSDSSPPPKPKFGDWSAMGAKGGHKGALVAKTSKLLRCLPRDAWTIKRLTAIRQQLDRIDTLSQTCTNARDLAWFATAAQKLQLQEASLALRPKAGTARREKPVDAAPPAARRRGYASILPADETAEPSR